MAVIADHSLRCETWIADCDAWDAAVFLSSLSEDEHARAARFHFPQDRKRFVVRRGLLRRLLGQRLAIPAKEVPLAAGHAGKPLLIPPPGDKGTWPQFNLARSGSLTLYALRGPGSGPAAAESQAIGVDLERVDSGTRTITDLRRVAAHFATEEAALIARLPDPEAAAAFYRCWTCKEACLKCLGCGIGSDGPSLADIVIRWEESPSPGKRCTARGTWATGGLAWSLLCFSPTDGHAAAVALPACDGATAATDGDTFDIHLAWLVAVSGDQPTVHARSVSPAAGLPPGPGPGAP